MDSVSGFPLIPSTRPRQGPEPAAPQALARPKQVKVGNLTFHVGPLMTRLSDYDTEHLNHALRPETPKTAHKFDEDIEGNKYVTYLINRLNDPAGGQSMVTCKLDSHRWMRELIMGENNPKRCSSIQASFDQPAMAIRPSPPVSHSVQPPHATRSATQPHLRQPRQYPYPPASERANASKTTINTSATSSSLDLSPAEQQRLSKLKGVTKRLDYAERHAESLLAIMDRERLLEIIRVTGGDKSLEILLTKGEKLDQADVTLEERICIATHSSGHLALEFLIDHGPTMCGKGVAAAPDPDVFTHDNLIDAADCNNGHSNLSALQKLGSDLRSMGINSTVQTDVVARYRGHLYLEALRVHGRDLLGDFTPKALASVLGHRDGIDRIATLARVYPDLKAAGVSQREALKLARQKQYAVTALEQRASIIKENNPQAGDQQAPSGPQGLSEAERKHNIRGHYPSEEVISSLASIINERYQLIAILKKNDHTAIGMLLHCGQALLGQGFEGHELYTVLAGTKWARNNLNALNTHAEQLLSLGFNHLPLAEIAAGEFGVKNLQALADHAEPLLREGVSSDDLADVVNHMHGKQSMETLVQIYTPLAGVGVAQRRILRLAKQFRSDDTEGLMEKVNNIAHRHLEPSALLTA